MENGINRIELLYFEDCPSWKIALKNLEEINRDRNITDEIYLISVETNEEAVRHEFTGSPTIKVNGKDIFPTNHKNYALGCRIYNTPEGFKGYPTKEMISKKMSKLIG